MKYLVIFACIAFVAVVDANESLTLTDEHKANVRAYIDECLKQEKLAPEAIEGLIKGNFSNRGEHLQCFVNCYLEKTKTFVNGNIKENIILGKLGSLVGEDKLKGVMAKCNALKGANNCETAFILYECYYGEKAAFM